MYTYIVEGKSKTNMHNELGISDEKRPPHHLFLYLYFYSLFFRAEDSASKWATWPNQCCRWPPFRMSSLCTFLPHEYHETPETLNLMIKYTESFHMEPCPPNRSLQNLYNGISSFIFTIDSSGIFDSIINYLQEGIIWVKN